MRLGSPIVEAAHDGEGARVRRPHAENGAGLAIVGDKMSSHLFVEAVVAAFVEKVEVLVGEKLRGGERGFRAHGVRQISLPEPAKGWP